MKTFRQLLKGCPILVLLIFSSLALRGQINETFSDGDFLQNPPWGGDAALFTINDSLVLQSNGMAQTEIIYLSTPNSHFGNTEWRIDLDYPFSPSTSNYIRIYLSSDQDSLNGPLHGYYLQVGESGSDDSYDLYRQDGNQSTLLINGADGRASDFIHAQVKVRRTQDGVWSLFTDVNHTGNFFLEGTAQDTTYLSAAFLGIQVKHSASRKDEFFFDNIYVGEEIIDTIPPVFSSGWLIDSQTIGITFNEPVDSSSNNHFLLIPGDIQPDFVSRDSVFSQQLSLHFADPFISPHSYQLIIEGITDLNGNQMSQPDTFSFEYIIPENAKWKDVIINEVMADPTPSNGLPEEEFLEIYNRSSKILNLKNWTLTNGSSTGILPEYFLFPDEYLIICPGGFESHFSGYGMAISPNQWPSLVNQGDHIGLRNAQGTLIDTLEYSSSWLENQNQGGVSLELIYPDNLTCPPISNWAASADSMGGTPGKVNSVFVSQPDPAPPEIVSASFFDQHTITVCLNTSMNVPVMTNPAFYSLSYGFGKPDSISVSNEEQTCVALHYSSPIEKGIIYTLEISDLEDCLGNTMTESVTRQIILGENPFIYDLVFTEIMADYSPGRFLPEAEFVEIFNRSPKVISLEGISLSDGIKTGKIDSGIILPGEYLILCAEADTALFSPYGNVWGLSSFPSLDNQTDSLFLSDPSENLIDYVFYNESWYKDPEKTEGGWTLEKLDLDFTSCNHAQNWQASQDTEGGTPGKANSSQKPFSDSQAPLIEDISLINSHTIRLSFNESMNPNDMEDHTKYQANHRLNEPLLARGISPFFTEVILVFDEDFDSSQIYQLEIHEMSDCSGNVFEGDIGFGIPQASSPGDILINEILFNPYSGGSDFVEIVNVSEKVLDLQDVLIGEIYPGTDSIFNSNRISEKTRLLLPGEMVCLTKDVLFQQTTYQPPQSAQFLALSDFPTYDDKSGEAVILNRHGEILDRFAYLSDYHSPTLSDQNGVSLERISLRRSSADPDNWHSAGSNVRYATPGYENSQALSLHEQPSQVSLAYQVFTPDGDGDKDVLPIQYDFDFPGAHARMTVFDAQGHKIKEIVPGALLAPGPGTYFWDGTDQKNQKADVGIYVILFEVVNQNSGEIQRFRLTGVLGADF